MPGALDQIGWRGELVSQPRRCPETAVGGEKSVAFARIQHPANNSTAIKHCEIGGKEERLVPFGAGYLTAFQPLWSVNGVTKRCCVSAYVTLAATRSL